MHAINVTRPKRKITFTTAPDSGTATKLLRRAANISMTDAIMAAAWLNHNKAGDLAAYKRMVQLKEDLEKLTDDFDSLRQQRADGRASRLKKGPARSEDEVKEAFKEGSAFTKLHKELYDRFKAFNQRLAQYPFVPRLTPDLDLGIRYGAFPAPTQGPGGSVVEVSDGHLTIPVDESTCAAALARLAARHELHRVRICEREQCGTWLFSERTMDRFCGNACRQAWYRAQPDYQDHRRKVDQVRRDHQKHEKTDV